MLNKIREGASNAGKYNCPLCVYDFVGHYNEDKCLNCKSGDNFVARVRNSAELMYDGYLNSTPKE